MIDYINPRKGPVIDGVEDTVFAKYQPEYNPLRALVGENPQVRVTSRWSPTQEQRKSINEGADIFLTCLTFGRPLQPLLMAVGDGVIDPDFNSMVGKVVE